MKWLLVSQVTVSVADVVFPYVLLGLMPTKLSEIADHGDFALFDELNGCECVECGCCSYICPAKRRLTQSMKTGRREAMALRRKKK